MEDDNKKKYDMLGFEPPEPPRIKKTEIFGKPGKPLGRCSKCKKYYNTDELQKYMPSPAESYWLCSKCAWKRRLKEKFSSSIG